MQKIQLAIPEPCHENWQQMTPTEQGRFCNACAKEVIDFSTMTDIQVLNYFTNLTHEKVCGRALPEQLERTISRPEPPKKRLFWYWNYVLMFFMFFAKGSNAKAQSCSKPATELTPATDLDIRGEVIAMGGVKRGVRQELVIGKVLDEKGNPIPFAAINIKGEKTGVSTDEKGEFKINTLPLNVLTISAVGFQSSDIPVANQKEMKIVLGNSFQGVLGGAVVVGYYIKDGYQTPETQKFVAMLSVKDFGNNIPIEHANIIVTKKDAYKSDIFFTNANGQYKMKGIKPGESWYVQIKADGYESNEFTINAKDFKDRKKDWEVLLRKQKVEITKPLPVAKPGTETRIRMGAVNSIAATGILYVVDGVITKSGVDINPDDVSDYSIIKSPEAMALFGSAGANGAVVITTRQSKVKKLDTVTVTGYGRTTGKLVCTSSSYTVRNKFSDSLKVVVTKLTGAIKLYPNPVQRGEQFNIALKLKQAGFYQVQVTDATGRMLLQKQISANSKEVTEKLVADNRWSSGAYYISIINDKNQLISKAGFIVK